MNLKEKLMLIKENDYQAPPDTFKLIQEMINNIGSVDAELRDELIYTTFYPLFWITTICFSSLVKQIQTRCSPDHSRC